MATFSYEVSPYRRADGTHLIKIRMIHNREVIRKPSAIYVTRDQLSRDLSKVRDAAVLDSINRQLDRLRKAVASIDGAEFYVAAALWEAVNARIKDEKGFSLDFFTFADTMTATMERGTADGYRYACNAFKKFLGRDELDVNDIDKALVSDFREWIEKRNGKGCRSASAYLEKLRTIHSRARERYNDDDIGLVRIPRQPFRGMIPPQPVTDHRVLTLDQLLKVWYFVPTTPRESVALAAFKLSFVLIGMNTVDLYGLTRADLNGGVLTYNRAKTDSKRKDKAIMKVRVEPEAEVLMESFRGRGALLFFADRYSNFKNFNQAVNKGLKNIADAINEELKKIAEDINEEAENEGIQQLLPEKLNFYYARHTWATIARNMCGIEKDTVHEALNHASRGNDQVTDIYIERDWSRVWDANRKVLDFVLNPPTSDPSPAAATRQTPHGGKEL